VGAADRLTGGTALDVVRFPTLAETITVVAGVDPVDDQFHATAFGGGLVP
jgi:hypothetical protein